MVFKKSYIVQKGPPLGDKKLKTKEKKKTKIKREKRLVQPEFCKFKETLDCRVLKTILKRIYVRGGRFQLLFLSIIIIKFGYNARCLWLKEHAL